MAWDTKPIIRTQGDPAPQAFDPVADIYKVVQSTNNAMWTILKDEAGNFLGVTNGKLNIRASEIETILNTLATAANQATIIGHVDGIETALGTLNTAVSTAANQTTIIGHIDTLEALITTLNGYVDGLEGIMSAIRDTAGIKKITDSLPAGTNTLGNVKLTDGTDTLGINTNGSVNIVPVNSTGTELYTASNPALVSLSGRNAIDDTQGNAVSFVLDGNGRPVLRVVDAAPFAYDSVNDRMKVVNKTDQQQLITNHNINQGDYYNFWFNGLSFTGYSNFSLIIKADNSHSWEYSLLWSPSTSDFSKFFQTVPVNAVNDGKNVNDIILLDNFGIQIVNHDAVAHTYDAWLRLMP